MDKFTVRSSSGSVDVSASATAYAEALSKWVVENEADIGAIEGAVEAVFDEYPTARLPMAALVSKAVSKMDPPYAQYKSLSERVHKFVTATSAKNTGRIDIAKGNGGGVLRLAVPGAEIPARPAKKTA